MNLSRRGFLTGATLAGGALGLAALSGCAPRGEEEPLSETGTDTSWNEEYDVVILGGGTGQAAAMVAALEGLSVLVVEKRDMLGGAMAFSGGAIWLPNNKAAQAKGDSYDMARTFLGHMQMTEDNEDIIDAFLNNTQTFIDYADKAGLPIEPNGQVDSHNMYWEGAFKEDSARIYAVLLNGEMEFSGGGGRLNTELMRVCDELGVASMTGASAKRLVTQPSSTEGVPVVTGVVVEDSKGAERRIKANKGVILATGGFEWNDTLTKHFLRVPARYALSFNSNTGDGLRMAQSVGAELRYMNEFFGMPVITAHGERSREEGVPMCMAGSMIFYQPGSILVDQNGRRFCDESGDYDTIPKSFYGFNNEGYGTFLCDPAWWICDDEHFNAIGGIYGIVEAGNYPYPEDMPEDEIVVTADTFEELGEAIGINSEQLARTVAEFNEYAEQGSDPLFHRGEDPCFTEPGAPTPLGQPPYHAVSMSAGMVGTKGGPKLNGHAQVMSVLGEPVEGLYAMGNCSGVGAPGIAYGGPGGTIGPAFVMGTVAVRHMAGLDG